MQGEQGRARLKGYFIDGFSIHLFTLAYNDERFDDVWSFDTISIVKMNLRYMDTFAHFLDLQIL